MVFCDNRKKIYAFSPPPPPVDELFDGLSGKRNVAEKKILASNWGMKKNSSTEKLPNPPLKNLMVRPLHQVLAQITLSLQQL
jgi:hypothetical protein